MAQVGVEMVAPLCLGLYLDHLLGWSPWGLVTGAVLGFGGGVYHLIILADKLASRDKRPPKGPRS